MAYTKPWVEPHVAPGDMYDSPEPDYGVPTGGVPRATELKKQWEEDGWVRARVSSHNPLRVQEGGGHYKDLKIQPIEYIHANDIPFAEGCAIKYLTRWRNKGGIEDLKKAKHFIEMLIELETKL